MSEAGAQADPSDERRAREGAAAALGVRLAELIDEPEAFVATLVEGLEVLVEPAYLAAVTRACPETPARYALRRSASDALLRPIRRALREGSSVIALRLAQRLHDTEHRDLRLYAHAPLRRALPEDPELSWQVMRRLGHRAEDWIATDSLADLWARGVLAEPFRWAELEQLLYALHTYERRLVAATLATMPHRLPTARRHELRPRASAQALELIAQLMGDREPMVQKALSWAIREWTPVDPDAVRAFLRDETASAVTTRDGARAWVVRDALAKQPVQVATELASRLAGIRRDRSAPSTSIAAGRAADFAAALAHSRQAVDVQGARFTRRTA
jgi:3-methyladenine DNA glycosylase AlkD